MIQALISVVVIVVVFLTGWRMGRSDVQAKWDASRLVQENIALQREEAYERQLTQAARQTVADRTELDALRAVPHPRKLLCHAAPVPDAPAASSPAPSGGALPQDVGLNTDALYTDIADAADSAIEDCRAALATWPR